LHCTGTNKGHNDCNNIDSQLKLEELGDTVIYIATPHNGLNNAAKVIIREDDVGSLLGDVCAGDALQTSATYSRRRPKGQHFQVPHEFLTITNPTINEFQLKKLSEIEMPEHLDSVISVQKSSSDKNLRGQIGCL